MAHDPRLVAKGRGEPRAALAEQGRYQVALAKEHEADLAKAGWPAADTAALAANVTTIESAAAAAADARGVARSTTVSEHDAVTEVKTFIRILRHALPRVLREHKDLGVTAAAFHAGATLGRATPKLSAYLATIAPALAKLDEALKPAFGGKSAVAEAARVKKPLDEADAIQETAQAGLPEDSLAVYEMKGRVLEAIEDLNRAGKIAFDGQATLVAKFNKDILLRGRRARKAAAAAAAAAPAEETKPK